MEASQSLREFAGLARLDQLRCLHEGDVDEAGTLARAVYRSGGHASTRGPLVAGLIGVALHFVGSEAMARWAEHPSVTGDQLRIALAQVSVQAADDNRGSLGSPWPVRAKRVIFLFMHGGPSQVDTFDYKPLLERDNGKPLPFDKPRIQFAQTGNLLKSPWKFAQHGESGAWESHTLLLIVRSIINSPANSAAGTLPRTPHARQGAGLVRGCQVWISVTDSGLRRHIERVERKKSDDVKFFHLKNVEKVK